MRTALGRVNGEGLPKAQTESVSTHSPMNRTLRCGLAYEARGRGRQCEERKMANG
jgi:hypothetical protein